MLGKHISVVLVGQLTDLRRIDGLTEDLKLEGTQFNVALVVFYVPYILVDVPSNWVSPLLPPVMYRGAD